MSTKILVATHKPYHFPDNELYIPIHVGKALSQKDFGYLGDDSGENISYKNRNFCELTALYWAWKNNYFNAYKYVGLVHYRRYFAGELPFGKFSILSEQQIDNLMQNHDIILPKKRKYYIETIRDHYAHAHNLEDLLKTREIIEGRHPKFIEAFDKLMEHRSLYLYNMFLMKKIDFDNYMQWLFDILFELEKRIDISFYDNYQGRVFGFISERLFNVWIIHHKLHTKEIKVINIEGENIPLKITGLLKRKFLKTQKN